MTTRRNNKPASNNVVVTTIDQDTADTVTVDQDTADTADLTSQALADYASLLAMVTTDSNAVSVAMGPCGYPSTRVNHGAFAVSYRHTRNARALAGMVSNVYATLAKADKAAAGVNAGKALNPADTAYLVAGSALVLPAYVVSKSDLPAARALLGRLYDAWLQAESNHANALLTASA